MSTSSLAGSRVVTAARSWSVRSVLAFVLPLSAVVGVAAAKGGFFATSFGWTALAFAWTTMVAVAFTAVAWRRLDALWLIAASAASGFAFVSAAWAGSAADAAEAGFRSLVYVTGVAGALVLLRRRDVGRWLGGLVLGAAAVCVYALATRLFPRHFSGFDSADYRLFEPLGYWNGLGAFAAIALLLALGVAALGRGLALRVAAAAAAIVLAPTLFFTFSRGAWLALAGGALVMLAASPYRIRLVGATLALGALPAAAVLLASRQPALTHRGSTLAQAASDGRSLAGQLGILLVCQAVVAALYVVAAVRVEMPAAARRAVGIVLVVVAAAALAAVFVAYESPVTMVRNTYDSFVSAPPGGANLNGRLFSLSNDGRIDLWHVAWHDFSAHPVAGSGAGSYARYWLQHRPSGSFVQDAHNLYLQTLAEGGVIGLVLLAAFLGLPLVAAWRARRSALVGPALGAYVVFVLHAAVDWDWQLPAVTLLALFTAAAIVTAARRGTPAPQPMGRPLRLTVAGIVVAAGAAAFVGLVGNIALARSNSAILSLNGSQAASAARKAHRWAPWSAEALSELGRGQLLSGSRAAGLATLRQAAAADPGNWETWFDIAAVSAGAERRAALDRARALNPHSPEIADVLAHR
jgi:O-Antigen ligase